MHGMVGEEARPVVAEICLVDINDDVLAPSPKKSVAVSMNDVATHI
jgi:hypothetical protein